MAMTVSEMARLGGKARAAKLTKEERKESARKAINARWAKIDKTVADITKGTKALEKKALRKKK